MANEKKVTATGNAMFFCTSPIGTDAKAAIAEQNKRRQIIPATFFPYDARIVADGKKPEVPSEFFGQKGKETPKRAEEKKGPHYGHEFVPGVI